MTLYHEEFGRGAPLIICHGFLGASSNWRRCAERLSKDYHVYVLDLRNHGLSFHDHDCTYPSMAQDVLEFILHHRLESPVLLGHSMGGKVIMQAASDSSVDLSKLIVVDIAPKAYDLRHLFILKALEKIGLGDLRSLSELDHVLSLDIPDPVLRGFLLKNVIRDSDGLRWKINLEGLTRGYSDIAASPSLRPSIELPTLFVRGGRSDYILLPQDDLTISTFFEDYQISTLDGVGHWVHIEAMDQFISVVLDFL